MKVTKSAADYGEGMRTAECGICEHFDAPNECEVVAGRVDSHHWCKFFHKGKAGK